MSEREVSLLLKKAINNTAIKNEKDAKAYLYKLGVIDSKGTIVDEYKKQPVRTNAKNL